MKSITQEIKERIFALYFGQKICVDAWHLESDPGSVDAQFLHYSYYERNHPFLLLKPLSAITDEDAIEVGRLWGGENYTATVQYGKGCLDGFPYEDRLPVVVADFLRSRSYALPAFGFTVGELIEAGVFKLKQ